jgi:hypothetical protein
MTSEDPTQQERKAFLLRRQIVRLSIVFWLVTFALLILFLLMLPRDPLPWLDETLFASASLSVLRGGPAVPTIMGAFPHTGRFDLLYGPLLFMIGTLDLKWFGLSLTRWRFLGFAGVVTTVFSAAWLSRSLEQARNQYPRDQSPEHRPSLVPAASAMFVALSQGVGARATCGRLDTITVTLELLTLAWALRAVRTKPPRWRALFDATATGLLCGVSALTTPRAFPFLLGLGVALWVEIVLVKTMSFCFELSSLESPRWLLFGFGRAAKV